MNFGLGLVLSFTDNASAGINNAVNSLNRLTGVAENAGKSLNEVASLSALSAVAIQVGHSFTNVGSSIIATLGGVISKVNATGQTLMFAESQLNKLYEGSGKTGTDVLAQIQQYAKTSIFEFEDLIPVVTSLKAVGIEAFDSIATSTGSANQTLMDYAADLAAFNPTMRNMYGTGIQAAMGAIKEYIAEGNALSLKRGAGLDITGILGEDKGATIEERSQQIADLIDKLGMVGMTAQMANTPMTKLSNMSDTLFQFMGMIAREGGVYDAFNEIIDVFANFVNGLDGTRLKNLAINVGEALSSLLTPVKMMAKVIVTLANGFLKLLEAIPILTKIIAIGTALTGVLLLISGVALVFMGSITLLRFAVAGFIRSFGSLRSVIVKFASRVMPIFKTLTLTMGLFYLAWKYDLFRLKTGITYFVNNLANSFNTARESVNGSVEDLKTKITELGSKDTYFNNLTRGIMMVQMSAKALADAWPDYTLSEDNFQKAKALGILPLIEAFLDFKYRFEHFKQGFIDGWKKISDNVASIFKGIKEKFKGTFLEEMINNLTSFMQKLTDNDAEAWYKFGEGLARVSANFLVFMGVLKLARGILIPLIRTISEVSVLVRGGAIAPVTFLGKTLTKLMGIAKKVGSVFTKLGTFFKAFGTAVKAVITGSSTVFNAFKMVFGSVSMVIAGVTSFISGVLIAITNFLSMLKTGFNWVKEVLMIIGVALATIGVIILAPIEGIGIAIAAAIGAIVAAVMTAVVLIKQHWGSIVELFTKIGTVVGDAISGAVKGAVNAVLKGATAIINGFIHAINGAIGIINAIPGVKITKLNILEVPKLAQGGIVEAPTMSIIGEAGTEAVMPLENNLGWISKLAGMITEQMSYMKPTSTNQITSSGYSGGSQYMTNNNSSSHVYEGNTDNSVVFNQGAIQINVQNATEEEATKLAKKIMMLIKRQNELDKMMSYA